jgi:hypothetical protein
MRRQVIYDQPSVPNPLLRDAHQANEQYQKIIDSFTQLVLTSPQEAVIIG